MLNIFSNKNTDYQKRLENLIAAMRQNGFLTNEKMESAIRNIPRHEFVPSHLKNRAYDDTPLPLLKDQTISQPSVVSRMTEWIDVRKGQKILEVGCGSGWQAALLSYLVEDGFVFSIERHPELANYAKRNLERLKIKNIEVIAGDGNKGLPSRSPFHRIMITAACKRIPGALLEQLDDNGLLLAPVGEHYQALTLIKKTTKGFVEIKNEPGYIFVPLYNEHNK